jgi:uncharacterized protein with FMN-binding domain
MKKIVFGISILLLLSVSIGCEKRGMISGNNGYTAGITNANRGYITALYKDGTYLGEGNKHDGSNENAKVVISKGQIASVDLWSIDKQGKRIDYNEPPNEGTISATRNYKSNLIKNIVERQTYNIPVEDVTSGTGGDNSIVSNWKLAVKRALDRSRM